jgi:hypothetical protein
MHWIINHQLGRRNLEALQRDMLIGRRHELEKGIQGGPQIKPSKCRFDHRRTLGRGVSG